jgi:hypothetical protein
MLASFKHPPAESTRTSNRALGAVVRVVADGASRKRRAGSLCNDVSPGSCTGNVTIYGALIGGILGMCRGKRLAVVELFRRFEKFGFARCEAPRQPARDGRQKLPGGKLIAMTR